MPKQIVGIRLPLAALVVLGVIGGDFLVRYVLDSRSGNEPVESATPSGWWTLTPEEQAMQSDRIFPERAFEDGLAEAPGIANVPRLFAPDPGASDIQYFPKPSASVNQGRATTNALGPQSGRAVVGASNIGEEEEDVPAGSDSGPTPSIDAPIAGGQTPGFGTPGFGTPGRVAADPENVQRPQELPRTPHASPIPDKSTVPSTRALIDRELPHLSQDEQQIWQETLQGLSPDMIRELLQFRRQSPISNADRPPAPNLQVPQPPIPQPPPAPLATIPLLDRSPQPAFVPLPPAAHPQYEEFLALLRQASNVLADNILNAETPGFKAADVMLVSALEPTATTGIHPHQLHVAVNMTQGALQRTDRPLDLAISGDGFFNVVTEGRCFYARCGRLSLDCDGNLCLRYGKQNLMLEPGITFPADAVRTEIAANGVVQAWCAHNEAPTELGTLQLARFLNPGGLTRRGSLFQVSERSGPSLICKPGQEGAGRIHQGFLETSNVHIKNQLRTMDRLREMATALRHFDSSDPAALIPMVDPSRLTIHDRGDTLRR